LNEVIMNTTRCCLSLLLATAFLGGCTGATFHPADRIDNDGDGFFAVEDPSGELGDREYLVQLAATLAENGEELDLVAARLDCDDANDNTFPNAAEQCDGEDNDCDGGLADFEADLDDDGFSECAWEHGNDEALEDCNDDPTDLAAPFQHPDRPEICGYHPAVAALELGVPNEARSDGLLDDNCDGELLEGEVDQDLDGFTVCELVVDIRAEVQELLTGDCVDTSANVYPGQEPVTCLDSGDFNSGCGANDQSLATIFYRDIDGDNDGDADPTDDDGDGVPNVAFRTCQGVAPPGRWVAQPPLQPDQDPADVRIVNLDCDDFNPNQNGQDGDEDGFTTCPTLVDPELRRDCDDGNSDTHPNAEESCDAEDNDCDGDVDEDYDDDLDGSFRVTQADIDAGLPSINCAQRGTAELPYTEDCDDADPTREELDLDGDGESTCENDCNDGDPLQLSADNDNDGYNTCTAILDQFDCDDNDASLNQDDEDVDGFASCPNAQGLADCDDNNDQVYPNNGEVQCDGVADTDCDGLTDPLDADDDNDGESECAGDCNDQDPFINTADADGDGFSTCTGDCDDGEDTVFPGAPQVCDDGFADNDCNGSADANEADVDGDTDTLCDGDCNDFDPALNSLDADGDNSTPCQGDCDDGDSNLTHLTDDDGDGWTACGSFAGSDPISQAVPADCNDDDPLLNWTDVDGDAVATCSDPLDSVTVADCDDFDPAMHNEDRDSDTVSPCGDDGVAGTADDDCDDDEPLVSGEFSEVRDGLDNDCSGIADDGITDGTEPDVGDLAVVEILIGAPPETGDGPSEYFEIYNPSGTDMDLRGWEVEVSSTLTGGSSTYVFEPAVGPGEELVLGAGQRAVVARSANADAFGTDVADFYWAGAAFSDAGGSLTLSFEGRDVDTISWLPSDCISNCGATQSNPTFGGDSTWRVGHAIGLQNLGASPHLSNDAQENLCEELTEQVSGQIYGSPGSAQGQTGACEQS
jgi:hypothetical protein